MRLRSIGAAIAMTLLLTAAPAHAIAAAEPSFQAGEYTAELKGQQEESQVFSAEGGLTVTCKSASLSGLVIEPATEITEVSPTYSECTTLFGIPATVATEGCTYTLDAASENVDIACPKEKAITITALSGTCQIKIFSQTGVSSVQYTTKETSPQAVTMNTGLKAVKYTKTKDEGACPFAGTGEKADGGLSGKVLLKAFGAAQVNFFVSTIWPSVLCEKNEVPCNVVIAPTTVEAKLNGMTAIEFVLNKATTTLKCTESVVKGTTAAGANGSRALPVTLSSFTFVSCGCSVSLARPNSFFMRDGVAGGGILEVNGTAAGNPTMTIVCGLDTCVYASTGFVGAVTGGAPATMAYTGSVMSLQKGAACGAQMKFTANYKWVAPKAGTFWIWY